MARTIKKRHALFSPPHYCALSLRNFRGFRNSPRIPLAPLTFLVGPNSSGKSSIFDALLLLTQSGLVPGHPAALTPSWGGPLVDLGSYRDTVYGHNPRRKIEIGLESYVPSESSLYGRVSKRREQPRSYATHVTLGTSSDDPVGRLLAMSARDPTSNEHIVFRYGRKGVTMEFLGRRLSWLPGEAGPRAHLRYWIMTEANAAIRRKGAMPAKRRRSLRQLVELVDSLSLWWLMRGSQRVSSGRAAPKRWYPVTDIRFDPGREYYAPRLLDTVDPTMLEEVRVGDPFGYTKRRGRPRVRGTMSSALRDLEIATSIRRSKLSPYHTSIDVRDNVTGVESNLIDVGYGASQVIPVLHACLSSSEGPLFVEQPEIHLHPKAQGILADLLCRTSHQRQVIVETHSVHMINRARLLVARGELQSSRVIVVYVARSSSGSRVHPIPIRPDGELGASWPGGFFDERYEDTLALLQLKGREDK